MELEDFLIQMDADIRAALRRIDQNQKGFLIGVDSAGKLQGTLTDGDIRRSILNGSEQKDYSRELVRDCCRTNCTYIRQDADFNDVIRIFKDKSIHFIPIVDACKKVVNVITKANMHGVLLQNTPADLTYDFIHMDENLLNYEIYGCPWGFYKTTILNSFYQSKIIDVRPMQSLSLQKHFKREEHWIVVNGQGTVQIGESVLSVQGGSYIFIPKGCQHRIHNTSRTESLIFIEVQRGQYFGEDDIVRYDDAYGRA